MYNIGIYSRKDIYFDDYSNDKGDRPNSRHLTTTKTGYFLRFHDH